MLRNKGVYLRLIDLIELKAAAVAVLKIAKKDNIKSINLDKLKDAVDRAEKLIKKERAK
jgi:hypothetical protein